MCRNFEAGTILVIRDKLNQLGVKVYKWVAMRRTLLPRFIEVETTKACNLRCPGCRRNYSEGSIYTEPGEQHLTVGALWRIVATTPVMLLRFEGDGEPLTNPNFGELVKFCHSHGIRSTMTSNGTLIDEGWTKFLESHGMVRIHVSFDGATKDTYERTKLGADYERTFDNCKRIGDSKIQLFMNVVLFSDEVVEELPKYVEQAKKVGATGIHCMKIQQDSLDFGTPPDLLQHENALGKFRNYARWAGLQLVGTYSNQPTFVRCYDPFTSPFALLNNDVYACTYMANLRRTEVYQGEVFPVPYQNYRMGNLEDDWMKDIWRNDAYEELRATLKEDAKAYSGSVASPEVIVEGKKLVTGLRFSFCNFCLCQWGESGL